MQILTAVRIILAVRLAFIYLSGYAKPVITNGWKILLGNMAGIHLVYVSLCDDSTLPKSPLLKIPFTIAIDNWPKKNLKRALQRSSIAGC